MENINRLREWVNGLRGAWIDLKDNSLIFTTGDDVPPSMDSVNLREHLNGILDDIVQEVEERYVLLPVDADGVPICIGDVMACNDNDNSKPMEVVALVPPSIFMTEEGPRFADMYRHYHAPTVEDILQEFSCVIIGKRSFDGDVADAIAEYATKISDILHGA